MVVKPASPEMIPAAHKGPDQTPALNVMHSTVGPTKVGSARAVANMFHNEGAANPTSAHYTIDSATEFQCVGDHTVAFHCGYNQNSLGYEMCDYPVATSLQHWLMPKSQRTGKKTIAQHHKVAPLRWLNKDHRKMLNRTAKLVARNSLAYGIPIRLLSDAELLEWDRKGRRPQDGGIVTHAQMSRVFHKSTHWDPGKWPRRLFLKRVRKFAKELQS
jgi:hypothetical protein